MPISLDAKVLLEQPIFASLATIAPDGHPQVTVVWIDIDDDGRPTFNTAAGRAKARNMERDPRITVLLLDPENGYRYVELRGTAELTRDGAEEQIDALAQKYLGTDYPFRRPDEQRVKVVMNVDAEHWMG